MVQFGYEHKKFDNTFSQVRKSAEEVNKMLNKMSKNCLLYTSDAADD